MGLVAQPADLDRIAGAQAEVVSVPLEHQVGDFHAGDRTEGFTVLCRKPALHDAALTLGCFLTHEEL